MYLNKLKITFSVVGVVMPCGGCLETSCLLWAVSLCASVCGPQRQSSSLKHHHHTDDIMFPVCRQRTATTMRRWCRWTGTTSWTSSSNRWDHELDTVRVVKLGTLGLFSLRRTITQRSLFAPKQRHKGLRQTRPKTQKKKCLGCDGASSGLRLHAISAWKISAKADKEVMMCKITLTL